MSTTASPRSARSSDSFISGRDSPIHGFDSSAALILVPDAEDAAGNASFEFTSDDDTDDEVPDHSERIQASSVPPLSSVTVFLYLLSPYLKLGTFLIPDGGLPLKVAVPVLFFFAGLSAFTRQIWYMLARYVRRADMEEIVLETFARERSKEGRRWLLRQLVRVGSGIFRVLLSAMYIRASVDVLLPLLPEKLLLPSYLGATLAFSVIIAPLYFTPTVAANRIIYATWGSISSYAAWFICIAYAHAHGILASNASSISLGTLWQGTSTIAFAFTTSSTIPLYAALKGNAQPSMSPRPRRSQSFKLLSAMSVGIAILCILPLVFFQSSDMPRSQEAASQTLVQLTAAFNAAALLLAVPSILIPTSSIPIPSYIRRAIKLPISKILVYILAVSISLLPKSLSSVLSDVLWLSAFLSTYTLPAFIHIILHNFRRPLSIIIPPTTPVPPSPDNPRSAEQRDSRLDELLQRKERTLQRRRLGRRIIWDIGVWVLLLPVGGGGVVWAGGKMAGRW
ncbi:uncharacterized protein LAESUDRAFT_735523 [Laetiporus sulphureus 93-53]|uniref:Amino acid transporter transmembrane domain-containing protein n=1 Tax=Laetiporus sulphureus 93-53 TaxID=1314785 RepID=A0A165FNZ5_9APHY|nr:uncharacterized protein LAESUDRAFT_735523 [Laetiporus sulphureus 93-53]KZT09256.1 hypothetical protein LAESUDRAFT_735523 [Laetiporus sulphureus 93-53]